MLRNEQEMLVEERQNMRGGEGIVQLRHLFSADELGKHARLSAEITLPPGASIGPHRHEGERELFYIIDGEARLTENGKDHIMRPGDASLTGPCAEHSISNQGKSTVRLVALIILD